MLNRLSRFTERLPLCAGKPLVRYGLTLALCLLALWVRWATDSVFPPGYPFVSFFPAVIFSSFLFGVRPGILAALLCGAFAWFVFIPPAAILGTYRGPIIAMSFYFGVVAIDIALIHLMQAANARLRAAREEVRLLADERGALIERSQVLFQELQHRVGNNLQMVGAVLSLQMRTVTEPAARKALSDAAARLQVIGNIQRHLYSHDGALVPLDMFLREVCAKVMASSAHPGITCEVEAEGGIVMRPDSAVPMALILAEALANALEHGLSGRIEGRIVVTVRRPECKEPEVGTDSAAGVIVTVSDDGAGLPPDFDLETTDSVGLRISRILARQLDSRHRLEGLERGTRMTLTVPASRIAAVDSAPVNPPHVGPR